MAAWFLSQLIDVAAIFIFATNEILHNLSCYAFRIETLFRGVQVFDNVIPVLGASGLALVFSVCSVPAS